MIENLFSEENLENIYNTLKGSENEITKKSVQSYLNSLTGDVCEIKEIFTRKDSIQSESWETDLNQNMTLSYEEFKIFVNETISKYGFYSKEDDTLQKQDLKEFIKGGFQLIDSNNKGYLQYDDLVKLNKVLNMNFTEEDLSFLVEMVSKNDSECRITLDCLYEFMINE